MFTASAGWDTGLILTPIISANQYQAPDTEYVSARLGGVVGFQYKQEGLAGLHGRTRAVYQQNFGSNLGFEEIKVGTYLGPRLGPIDLEIGADYMFNEYNVPGVYSGSFGAIATPLRVKFDVELVHVEVAAGPIFLTETFSGDTREGTNTPLGLGDEFFYMGAASIDIKPLVSLASVGISASRRITAYGVDNVIGAEFSILFFGIGSSGHAY